MRKKEDVTTIRRLRGYSVPSIACPLYRGNRITSLSSGIASRSCWGGWVPCGGWREHDVSSRLAFQCEAGDAIGQSLRLQEGRLIANVKVQVRHCRVSAVTKMCDHIPSMDMVASAHTHTAGSQVGVVSKDTARDFQNDEVPVESPRGEVRWLRMSRKRLTVRLAITRVAHDSVCHCEHIGVIAEPRCILRSLRGIWRNRQCVACGVQPDKVNGETLRYGYNSVHRLQASPVVRLNIPRALGRQPEKAATKRRPDFDRRL